jgi:hypothetical protein
MRGDQRRTRKPKPKNKSCEVQGFITRTTKIKEDQEGVVSENYVAVLNLLSRYGQIDIKLTGKERVLLIGP